MTSKREIALEKDLLEVAEQLRSLRDFMSDHLNAPISMLPNDFWQEVDRRLTCAQVRTDIAEYFPNKPLITYRDELPSAQQIDIKLG